MPHFLFFFYFSGRQSFSSQPLPHSDFFPLLSSASLSSLLTFVFLDPSRAVESALPVCLSLNHPLCPPSAHCGLRRISVYYSTSTHSVPSPNLPKYHCWSSFSALHSFACDVWKGSGGTSTPRHDLPLASAESLQLPLSNLQRNGSVKAEFGRDGHPNSY